MNKQIAVGVGFYALVMLCLIVVSVQASPNNYLQPQAQDGWVDLSGADFSKNIAQLDPAVFTHYPEQLLAPGEAGEPGSDAVAPFGTYRARLVLPAPGVYAVSQTTNDMALRVMVDGQVIGEHGRVGRTAEESRALAGTFVTAFYAATADVELSYQYSGFVRHYRPPSVDLGASQLIVAQQEGLVFRGTLFAACLLIVAILALGLYLFLGVEKAFLWFSLSCLALAIHTSTRGVMLLTLLWPINSVALARVEYLTLWCVMYTFFLYADAVFGHPCHAAARRIGEVGLVLCTACVLLLPPLVFTAMRVWFLAFAAALAVYFSVALVLDLRRRGPQTRREAAAGVAANAGQAAAQGAAPTPSATAGKKLVLTAVLLMAAVTLSEETIWRWVLPYRLRDGILTDCAMIGAILLNTMALALHTVRAKQELGQAQSRERELREMNRVLDELSAAKTRVIANISHEIRTPLTVMSANVQLSKALLGADADRGEIAERLDVVDGEAMRLARMVSEVLQLSMIREGAKDLARVDLRAVLERVVEVYRTLLEKNGNALRLDLPRGLPHVWGDADKLVQVFVNLLANANAHTRDGEVTIHARCLGDEIVVAVVDTGTGIAPELLPHVFERGHSGGPRGAGVGLAISKMVVEQHGGRIDAASSPGAGTTVRLVLPALQGEEG
ncbi:MAG: sensor histidine kinase [Bifidobacteriaceae bacterium]|nr:sensor histidine kinase [Bifidobacteriaceae bacterium]